MVDIDKAVRKITILQIMLVQITMLLLTHIIGWKVCTYNIVSGPSRVSTKI